MLFECTKLHDEIIPISSKLQKAYLCKGHQNTFRMKGKANC